MCKRQHDLTDREPRVRNKRKQTQNHEYDVRANEERYTATGGASVPLAGLVVVVVPPPNAPPVYEDWRLVPVTAVPAPNVSSNVAEYAGGSFTPTALDRLWSAASLVLPNRGRVARNGLRSW
jgi:hypothetical protein